MEMKYSYFVAIDSDVMIYYLAHAFSYIVSADYGMAYFKKPKLINFSNSHLLLWLMCLCLDWRLVDFWGGGQLSDFAGFS